MLRLLLDSLQLNGSQLKTLLENKLTIEQRTINRQTINLLDEISPNQLTWVWAEELYRLIGLAKNNLTNDDLIIPLENKFVIRSIQCF